MWLIGFANRNRARIISWFKVFYFLLFVILFTGVYSIATKQNVGIAFFYDLGVSFGRAALFLLTLAVIPGILGRFRVRIQITFILTNFRRYIGISVFLLAFSHFMLVKVVPGIVFSGEFLPSLLLFELMGFSALMFLLPLFLTSNDWSVIHLGKWWKRLHRIIYIALWLVFLHVALQRVSIWTAWIGFIAVLETASFVFHFLSKHNDSAPVIPQQK